MSKIYKKFWDAFSYTLFYFCLWEVSEYALKSLLRDNKKLIWPHCNKMQNIFNKVKNFFLNKKNFLINSNKKF